MTALTQGMTPSRKRILAVVAVLGVLGIAAAIVIPLASDDGSEPASEAGQREGEPPAGEGDGGEPSPELIEKILQSRNPVKRARKEGVPVIIAKPGEEKKVQKLLGGAGEGAGGSGKGGNGLELGGD